MIKFVVGLALLWLFVYALKNLYRNRKLYKKVDASVDRLHVIKNEHKILDIEEEVEGKEAKLKERIDAHNNKLETKT